MPNPSGQRLASLDALRGFDLFVLVALGPLVSALTHAAQSPYLDGLSWAFTHVSWEGFAPWDLVMPLFLFMAGASIPFALSRYQGGANRGDFVHRLLKRIVLLWLLGMVVQGNLLAFDPSRIYLYTNTLQAIASGYFIAAVAFTSCRWQWLVVLTLVLLGGYWALMEFVSIDGYGAGAYTPQANLAEWVDRTVLGRFRDGAALNADGSVAFASWYHYTWIVSTLGFGATTLTGVFAGIVARAGWSGVRKVVTYLVLGAAMVVVGWFWGEQMPIIKTIWTSSMVLFSSGWCFVLMGVFFLIYDVFHLKLGLDFLRIYGMNSIAAYVLSEVVNFRGVAHSVCFGLEQWLGVYYGLLLALSQVMFVFLILKLMLKHNVFLKV